MDFRASGNRFIPLLDQIFALLATPFPVPHPPAYQRLLRSYEPGEVFVKERKGKNGGGSPCAATARKQTNKVPLLYG
jgi:hypothetical protein